jgi:hypothetical protein
MKLNILNSIKNKFISYFSYNKLINFIIANSIFNICKINYNTSLNRHLIIVHIHDLDTANHLISENKNYKLNFIRND